MSDHCEGCRYRVKERSGERACPFNPLFWDFLVRHRERFGKHPRIGALYRTWDRFSDDEKVRIRESAARILDTLEPSPDTWRFDDDRC
jgi:deoxyribodipyrimidine photolyase-related protein